MVAAQATDTNQTIFIVYDFDAENAGEAGAGYEEVLATGISAVDFPPPSQTGDDGNIGLDGNETVTKISESYRPAGSIFGDPNPANRAEHVDVVVKVTGLDPAEMLIVRIDARLSCFAFPVSGNLHAAISAALYDADSDGAYPDADDQQISVGQQDVPMLFLDQLATPIPMPVGGVAELPHRGGSEVANRATLAGLALALAVLTAGALYARRRWGKGWCADCQG